MILHITLSSIHWTEVFWNNTLTRKKGESILWIITISHVQAFILFENQLDRSVIYRWWWKWREPVNRISFKFNQSDITCAVWQVSADWLNNFPTAYRHLRKNLSPCEFNDWLQNATDEAHASSFTSGRFK